MLLEKLFKKASYQDMQKEDKDNYMKSIMGEADYEANLYDWREEGLAEGRAEGSVPIDVIAKCTGLSKKEIEEQE